MQCFSCRFVPAAKRKEEPIDDEESILRKMRRLTDYYDVHKEIGRWNELSLEILLDLWDVFKLLFSFTAGERFPTWSGWSRKPPKWSTPQNSSRLERKGRRRLWERWDCCPSWTTRESSTSTTPLRRRTQSSSSQRCILKKRKKFSQIIQYESGLLCEKALIHV